MPWTYVSQDKKPFSPSNSGGVCFTHRECAVRDIVEVRWPFSFEVVYPCSLIPTNGKIRQRWSTFTLQRLPTDFLFRWVLDYDLSPTYLHVWIWPYILSCRQYWHPWALCTQLGTPCCPVFSPSQVLYAGVASKYFVRLELSEAYVNGISGSEKGHFDNGGCQLTA